MRRILGDVAEQGAKLICRDSLSLMLYYRYEEILSDFEANFLDGAMDLGNCDGDLLYLSASKRYKLNISLFWEIFFILGVWRRICGPCARVRHLGARVFGIS